MPPSVYRFSLKSWDHVLLIRIVVTEPNYRGIISLTVYNRKISPDFRFIMLNERKKTNERKKNEKKNVRYSLKQKARLSCTCRCNIIYTLMISIKLWSFFFQKIKNEEKTWKNKMLTNNFSWLINNANENKKKHKTCNFPFITYIFLLLFN